MKVYIHRLLRSIRKILRAMFPGYMHARVYAKMKRWTEVEQDLLPIAVDRQLTSVDVGAFVGSYTLPLAKLSRTVYAFEPDAEMANMLRHVAPSNVRVFRNAVSDREGTSEFHVPTVKGRRAVTCGSLVTPKGSNYDMRRVKTTTLDAALARSDVGFIKIDVEGAELPVLMGAQQLIARCRPVILVEINSPEGILAVSAFLEPLEYAGFFVREGSTSGLHEFSAAMQDSQPQDDHASRQQMQFVNNFFFAPIDAEKNLRTEMDRVMAAGTGAPASRQA